MKELSHDEKYGITLFFNSFSQNKNTINSRYGMYNIGICDNGTQTCEKMEDMIITSSHRQQVEVDIGVWYTGETLCDYLKQGNHLDILFLDIELMNMTGMEVGDYIRSSLGDRSMQIIYISNKACYAQQLFKTQPMDFLVKPITQEQIDETLKLAFQIIGKNRKKFEFRCGRDYYYIPYADILYFNSDGKKLKLLRIKRFMSFMIN